MATYDSPALPIGHGVMERLPRGRHDIPLEQVRSHQRRRLTAALDELILYGPAPTVTAVHRAAGVSRTTFYEHWPSIGHAVEDRRRVLSVSYRGDSMADRLVRALLSTSVAYAGAVTQVAADLVLALLREGYALRET